jgi:adenylate cyclase class 2
VRANVEIKARVADLASVRERVARLAARRVGVDEQVDTYFRAPHGRLKLRESSLSGAQLVPYVRPDVAAPRRSDYTIVPVEDPDGVKALLARILGVHRVVRKRREIWLAENVRIHLDEVQGLGSFLELEAVFDGDREAEPGERARLEELMGALGVEPGSLLPDSYEALAGKT